MADTKQIKFSQPWRNYNAGETAGLPAQQADHLVKHGLAAHAADAEKEAKANEKADTKDRAADKKRAPAAAKTAASEAKKKAAVEKKAAAKAEKEAAATE